MTKTFKTLISVLILFSIAFGIFAATPLSGARNTTGESVAVITVDKKTERITRAELDKKKAEYAAAGQNMTDSEVLDILINDKVFLMNAQKDGINITDAQIDDQVRQARAQLEQAAGKALTDLEFETVVQRQYGVPVSQLKETLKNQAILSEYLKAKRPNEINKTFTVTNLEIEKFYQKNKQSLVSPEAVRIAHIYKQEQQNAADNQKNKDFLTSVLARIMRGEITFESAVQEFSDQDATNSKANGGSVGWVGYAYAASLGDEFVDAAMSLKPGEVYSSVVHSPLGYHIIKATATSAQKFLTLDDYVSPESNQKVREYIRENLIAQKQQENFVTVTNAFVDELVAKAKITKNI